MQEMLRKRVLSETVQRFFFLGCTNDQVLCLASRVTKSIGFKRWVGSLEVSLVGPRRIAYGGQRWGSYERVKNLLKQFVLIALPSLSG